MLTLDLTPLKSDVLKYLNEYMSGKKVNSTVQITDTDFFKFDSVLYYFIRKTFFDQVLRKINIRKSFESGQDIRVCLNRLPPRSAEIGSGYFGVIYKLDNNRVAKITNLTTFMEKNLQCRNMTQCLNSIYEISKRAGELKIGPKALTVK